MTEAHDTARPWTASDFHYPLPDSLIAQTPSSVRGASRLLIVDRAGHVGATHARATHVGATHVGATHVGATHVGATHVGATHRVGATHASPHLRDA